MSCATTDENKRKGGDTQNTGIGLNKNEHAYHPGYRTRTILELSVFPSPTTHHHKSPSATPHRYRSQCITGASGMRIDASGMIEVRTRCVITRISVMRYTMRSNTSNDGHVPLLSPQSMLSERITVARNHRRAAPFSTAPSSTNTMISLPEASVHQQRRIGMLAHVT